jgi:sugar/nucleoside kinase (ribokinase family)
MILIDKDRSKELYKEISPEHEMSGGSAANSLSGFVSFGGKGAFIGKTADDNFGKVFRNDLRAQGIHYATPLTQENDATGLSYILVTPDGERTMNTYLGANAYFGPRDIDEKLIAQSKIVLLEGYLFDKPGAKAAFYKAAQAAQKAGTKIAFTLSDSKCVERHHADFTDFVAKYVDILFANQREIKALTLKKEFDDAAWDARHMCETVVITRGAKGAQISHQGATYHIRPQPVSKLVDTTGAGDAFAAGVLYGLSEGMDPARCGELGAKAASGTIAHIGARSPGVKFSDLLK